MNKTTILAMLLLSGCYDSSASLSDDELRDADPVEIEGLDQCDWKRSWSCVEEREYLPPPDDFEFCEDSIEGINLDTADAGAVCDYEHCQSVWGFSVYTYSVNPECYRAACPEVWHARAAVDLCTFERGNEDYEGWLDCREDAACDQWQRCEIDESPEAHTQFTVDVGACAVRTKEYLLAEYK